jgi:hypothetical protein
VLVVALLVARLGRVRQPRFEPRGTYAQGAVVLGTVRLGRRPLGWAVRCLGWEVFSRLDGGQSPRGREEGTVVRVWDAHGALRVDPSRCAVALENVPEPWHGS